ncbi:D-alanine--D-alanine ligase family protein [Microbacterium murale]|uniref:D-alanine--D-alanine ligase n=1 Tax=Microbacterium murale TaxID=1081040 RepID=A0ABU0P4R5_9MICO|nr:ATP-grasp domain-containing protein [Microbacterium murale]MDQ0642319.1 D-alanine-D-alanine ligase [Microbacterium murale]
MSQSTPIRIAVVGGGSNDEHAVSRASAASVVRAIRELNHTAVPLSIGEDGSWQDEHGTVLPAYRAVETLTGCDIAFPVLHGVGGEDGAIAGLLELCGVPYAGSPVRAGALGMDKHATKLIAESLGIATAKARVARPGIDAAVMGLQPPFVVKPAAGGSSNGVFVVADPNGVAQAVSRARVFGDTVLIEEYVAGREVDIAVFRDRHGVLRFGAALEIGVTPGSVFGAAEKYDGSAKFTVPAPISDADETAIRHAAVLMYEGLGCAGVARFDFFLTDRGPVLNEVNTAPGMTERSQVPLMYAATGLDYAGFIAELLHAVGHRPQQGAVLAPIGQPE